MKTDDNFFDAIKSRFRIFNWFFKNPLRTLRIRPRFSGCWNSHFWSIMIIFLNILRLTSDEEAEGFPIQVTPTIVNLDPLENCLLESYGTIFAQNRKKIVLEFLMTSPASSLDWNKISSIYRKNNDFGVSTKNSRWFGRDLDLWCKFWPKLIYIYSCWITFWHSTSLNGFW